jgi:dsDNA-specific endonuclease/ATPase MutS2
MDDYLDLNNPFPEPFEIKISDTFDLHAFAPPDVKAVVETYLAEAFEKNFQIVKIIHGKGIGIQKETVRRILTQTNFVKSFKGAPEFLGGWGATIVEFHKK